MTYRTKPVTGRKDIDMTRTTSLTLLVSLAALLVTPLSACGASKTGDEGKTEKPKTDEPKSADAKSDAPVEAGSEKAGVESYLLAALGELAAGGQPSKAETKAYGCGVKYAGEGGEPTAKIGEPAPAFTLPSVAGESISLADYAGKTVVLEWFNPDCPFVKYAHGEGGPLASLANEQSKAGIVWLAINSGAAGKEGAGVERNKQAQIDWKLEHPILIDEDGKVGRSYGAQTTPHMFVIDPAGKLIYAGALDNAPLGRVGG
jgi:peroxiredoxin